MNKEMEEILNEMKEICNVWVKVDGTMKSYTQDQIHCIYECITDLQKLNEKLIKELEEDNRVPLAKYNKLKNEKEELELRLFTIKNYKVVVDKATEYNNHLIEHAKYHLNLGHLKKMKKILEGVTIEWKQL